MLEEGRIVYFLVNGTIMEGTVMNVQGTKQSYTFEIEGVGGCGGPQLLNNAQLHYTIFLTREEANKWRDYEQAYLMGQC